MRAKLTARTVAAQTPKDKPFELFDTEIKGFLLRVEPTGTMTYYLAFQNTEGKRRRRKIGTHGNLTPVQARDVAQQLAADVAHGVDIQAEKVRKRQEQERAKLRTLRGFLDNKYGPWVTTERPTGVATLKRIQTNFADLLEKPMQDISLWLIEKWQSEERKRGKNSTTIRRDVVALKASLSKAVEWGILDKHPLKGLKPVITDDQGRVRYLPPSEEKQLREALDKKEVRIRSKRASANVWRQERDYEPLPDLLGVRFADYLKPMVLLCLNTGLRRGEVFKLTWDNVDLNTRILTVEGKTAKSRRTRHKALNDEALDVLKHWHEQSTGKDLVFPGRNGKRLDNIQTAWEGILRDARVKNFTFHDVRHTFASKLVMAGVDLNTVRELLGHSDIKMTLRYAHLAPEHKAEAVAKLNVAR